MKMIKIVITLAILFAVDTCEARVIKNQHTIRDRVKKKMRRGKNETSKLDVKIQRHDDVAKENKRTEYIKQQDARSTLAQTRIGAMQKFMKQIISSEGEQK